MEVLTVTANVSVNSTGDRKVSPLVMLAIPLIMFSTGALGNLLALVMLYKSRRVNRDSVFYRLVAAIVAEDLFGTMALSPVTILTYINKKKWIGGQPLCHYFSFMMIFAGLMTVLIVLCIAVERCLALLSPYFYERYIHPESVKALLTAVCLIALTVSCLPLLGVGQNVLHYPGTWCFFNFYSERFADKVFAIFYAFLCLALIVATAICNVASMAVLLRMRRVSQNISKSRDGRTLTNMTSEMQMIFLLVGITVVLAVCYCPLIVRVIISGMTEQPKNVDADLLAIRLASLHQILDPWIYLLLRPRMAALLYSACRSISPIQRIASGVSLHSAQIVAGLGHLRSASMLSLKAASSTHHSPQKEATLDTKQTCEQKKEKKEEKQKKESHGFSGTAVQTFTEGAVVTFASQASS